MRWLLDLLYILVAITTSPLWLTRMMRTGRVRTDWAGRFGRGARVEDAPRDRLTNDDAQGDDTSLDDVTPRPRVLLHAVSVGEVNALRQLIPQLVEGPINPLIIVAATTNTGYARAVELFADDHAVVRFPFDFSWAVGRFLDRVRPDVVALIELEVWPTFLATCHRRDIAVCVISGRLSQRSHRRYRRIAWLVRPMFGRLKAVGAQQEQYAERFIDLGVPPDRVVATDTMKWDSAHIADTTPNADALAESLGIDRAKPLIVAGSTAPDEHALIRDATLVGVQLLCAPRRPEWFDRAASDLPGCARRSTDDCGSATGRFLLDTFGELRDAYALADLVIVGRSFGDLHGSDMIEPIALGKAVIVGPRVEDFQDTAEALLEAGGLVQTTRAELAGVVARLMADPDRRRQLADNGRQVIRRRQGATARSAELILSLLPQHRGD